MARHGTKNPLTDRLGALSDPLRLRMLRVLASHELSVGEIAKVFQLPQSTMSRNLTTLARTGWLVKRQQGTTTLYSLIEDDLDEDARRVWRVVREQIPTGPETDEDDQRLEGVLAERKTDSLSFFGRVGGAWDAIRAELFGERLTALGLLSLLDPAWTVADIGCGTGNASELLAGCVGEVIAIDQSEAMLDAARLRVGENPRVSFIKGSLEALPLDDASVDAACCMLVMHHIEDPTPAMGELARTLRTERGGGVALLVDMVRHERHEYRREMGHRHLGFADEEIRDMFTGAGFEPPRIRHLPGEPDAKGPGLFAASARLKTD